MSTRQTPQGGDAAYHEYVFDLGRREFVGRFEEMYASEHVRGFDSWHERDLRLLRKQLSLAIIGQYNWARVLDLGCGKGTFTHLLKRKNNEVVGIDMSESAIGRAKASYPDIDFRCLDMTEVATVETLGTFDLTVVMTTLAYVERWPGIIEHLARTSRWLWVSEYIPADPIGYVKSGQDLFSVVSKHFDIRTRLVLDENTFMCLAERTGNAPGGH